MRRLGVLLALALLVAGCQDTGTSDRPNKDSVAPVAKMVQKRYADCLNKLDAKLDQDGPRYVSFDTKGGGYLVFTVTKRNGKTYTVPKEAKDAAMLSKVGC